MTNAWPRVQIVSVRRVRLASYLKNSKSTSGGILCISGDMWTTCGNSSLMDWCYIFPKEISLQEELEFGKDSKRVSVRP